MKTIVNEYYEYNELIWEGLKSNNEEFHICAKTLFKDSEKKPMSFDYKKSVEKLKEIKQLIEKTN